MKSTLKYEMAQRILAELKQPAYRFQQITDAIFKQRIGEYERMTVLPKGVKVTVRTPFGTDIDAACGQLYGR